MATINETLGTGAEGGALALDALGKESGTVKTLLGGVGKVTGVFGGILDGVGALHDLANGKTVEGLTGAGSAALGLAGTLAEVPGAQAAAAVIAVGGFGYSKIKEQFDQADHAHEFADLIREKTSLNLKPEVLDAITHDGDPTLGAALTSRADGFGVPPRQLLQQLNRFDNADDVRDYLDAVKELPKDKATLSQIDPQLPTSFIQRVNDNGGAKEWQKLVQAGPGLGFAKPADFLRHLSTLSEDQQDQALQAVDSLPEHDGQLETNLSIEDEYTQFRDLPPQELEERVSRRLDEDPSLTEDQRERLESLRDHLQLASQVGPETGEVNPLDGIPPTSVPGLKSYLESKGILENRFTSTR